MKPGKVVLLMFLVVIPALFLLAVNAFGPDDNAMALTERALANRMKDPDSMVIKSSFVVRKTDDIGTSEIFVCGIVDGKNSFGGYTGGTRFASRSVYFAADDTFRFQGVEMEDPSSKRTATEIGRISAFEQLYWNERCVNETHPPIVFEES